MTNLGYLPRAVPRFFSGIPTSISGREVEGGAASLISGPDDDAVPVLVLGPKVPGDDECLPARQVDGYWVAERGGSSGSPGGGVVLPACSCPVPYTLTMTSRDENCNYGMFRSCTLQYGPAPALMAAFGLTDPMFTSTETFVDPISKCSFFYYFECHYNQWFLTRIFPVSPISSPFRDGILYAWVVGGYLNTCRPFYLFNGTAFPGSDASCSIKVEGSATQVPWPPTS